MARDQMKSASRHSFHESHTEPPPPPPPPPPEDRIPLHMPAHSRPPLAGGVTDGKGAASIDAAADGHLQKAETAVAGVG